MEELINFYKSILEMFGFELDSNGQVFVTMNGVKMPITIDKRPLYLPTNDNIKTMVSIVDGKPVLTKMLFNPLHEDAIKGANKIFTEFKKIVELKLLGVIYGIGEGLFTIINNNSEINDMEIVKFISLVNKVKFPNVKHNITDKTLTMWVNLYEKILSEDLSKKYIKFYIKKGGKINDVKYNRLGVIEYPFIEALNSINPKKDKFLGYKLSRTQIHVYNSLFEYLFGDLSSPDNNQFGSLNTVAPSMHVLLIMYNHIYEKLKPTIDVLLASDIEDDLKDNIILKPLPIRVEALGDLIDNLKPHISSIPTEDNLVIQQEQTINKPNIIKTVQPEQKTSTSGGSFWDRVKSKETGSAQPVQQPVPQPVLQPVMQPAQQPVLQPVQQPLVADPWAASQPMQPMQPMQVCQPIQPVQQQYPYGGIVNNDPWS